MPPRKILLIDDEEDIRLIARASLSRAGDWEVFCAATGEDGVAVALAQRPDVVLLDMMMPGMDGPAVLEALREHPACAETPVIFLTASATARDRCLALGAAGLISKPFNPLALGDEILEILTLARPRRLL